MSQVILTLKRQSPTRNRDKTTPELYYIDSSDIKKVVNNSSGGSHVHLSNRSRTSAKIQVFESPTEVEIARDPSSTNPNAFDKDTSITAAGSAQGAGFNIVNFYNVVDTATDTSAEALDLPAATAGKILHIINDTGVALEVFPASGETINGAAANAVYDHAAYTRIHYYCKVAGAWEVLVAA